MSVPQGIAVDYISRLVYYTDAGDDIIGVFNTDFKNHYTVINLDMDQPSGIALDPING